MKIDKFEMMRMQCLYEKQVEFDLSETTVLPLRVFELLEGVDDVERFIANELWYPESGGSPLFRDGLLSSTRTADRRISPSPTGVPRRIK
jgi:hypothetical protein